jgi:hypothetical protein
MKAACLLFLTMSCAVLIHGTDYAAPSQQTSAESSANTVGGHPHDAKHTAGPDRKKSRKKGNPSNEQRDSRYASGKNSPRSRASLTAAKRPKHLPKSRKSSSIKKAMNLHQSGSAKSDEAPPGGLIRNDTFNNTLTGRRPSVVRAPVQSPDNVRHHSPNPAIVGGSANSDIKNNGGLNGTRMSRKP